MLEYNNVKKQFYKAAKRKHKKRARSRRPGEPRHQPYESVGDVLASIDKEVPAFIELVRTDTIEILKHKERTINESSNKKLRNIIEPDYKYEQVLHHCIVSQLQSIIMHGLYEFAYGSIPGRGAHSAKKVLAKWIRQYRGKKFFVGQGDIKGFYDNLDLDVLEMLLAKICRDKRFLHINHRVISTHEKTTIENGIRRRRFAPKGYCTSGWYGHLTLKDLDHIIVRLPGVDHYIRYADDFIITGRNKKLIHKAMMIIAAYLNGELHLEIKHTWQVYRFEHPIKGKCDKKGRQKTKGRFIDFMGFQFHHDRTTMRKRNLCASRRKAHRIGKKKRVTWYDAAGMLSRLGSYKHTDTYGYYLDHIKPYVNVRKMKRTISNHSKKQNRKERYQNDRMAINYRNTGESPKGSGHCVISDNCISAKKYTANHKNG